MEVPGGRQFLNSEEVIAKSQVTQGMKVGDLGVGNLGYFAIPMAKAVGKGGIVYAVDIQKPVLEAVRNKAKLQGITNLEYVWANLEKVGSTQIPAASLDLVLLINVLFESTKKQEILKEAIRLLKIGGKLFIIGWKRTGIPFGPAVNLRLDPDDVANLASNMGLKLLEKMEIGTYFWGIILVK